jgi:hypothetical protein
MKISDTQLEMLSAAAEHEARLAEPPRGLPAAARNAVFRAADMPGADDLMMRVYAVPLQRLSAAANGRGRSQIRRRAGTAPR